MSRVDIPLSRYRAGAVFVEHRDQDERSAIEAAAMSAFRSAGVTAAISTDLFKGKSLSEKAKAQLIQEKFDAVLYISVLLSGMTEERL